MPAVPLRQEFLMLLVVWDGERQRLNKASTTCDAKAMDYEGYLEFDRFTDVQLKCLFPQLFDIEDEVIQW